MELVFVRHGESLANDLEKEKDGFFCGRWDCELTESGRMQARSLKGNSHVTGADAIFSSPLKRAVDTAYEFADREIICDARIIERSLGDFEGKWKQDLMAREEYRKYFTEKRYEHFRHSFSLSAPHGENYGDVVLRVTPFLEDLKRRNDRKIVIVSHAIAICCMLKVVQNLSEEDALKIRLMNCDPIRVEYC